MFKIHVESGAEAGRAFVAPRDLEDGHVFLVGRAAECDVVIPEEHVSSRHGEFVFQNRKLSYRDRNSTNGSALLRDGERSALVGAQLTELWDEDRLLLGNPSSPVRLRVEVVKALRPSPPQGQSLSVLAVSHMHTLHELEGRFGQDPQWGARLYRAAKLMGGSLELREVCEHACAAIFDLLPTATNISLLGDQRPSATGSDEDLTPPEPKDLVPLLSVDRAGQPLAGERPSRQLVQQVLAQKAAVVVCDTAAVDPSQSMIRAKIRSVLGAPLCVGERIVGIAQVDNRDGQGAFGQEELEALVVLVQQVALQLENARLFQRVAVAEQRLQGENRFLKGKEGRDFAEIIGQSDAMQRVFHLVKRVVDTKAIVMVTGETGTGKELVARAIHQQSQRRDKLFVAQNCSAMTETLLESELFGHKRGAFTGADADKKGLFELADKGTLFLDEIGETTPTLQAKLLRALQESEIRPVGAMYTKQVDVRVIAATNRDLQEEVKAGRFREDLYYRLNVFPIHLPPLRERGEDVALLADYFLKRACREFGRPAASFSPEASSLLLSYRWPGNIRELQNEVQRIVIHGVPGEFVLPEHLADRIARAGDLLQRINPTRGGLREMMDQVERWLLLDTLRECDNNKTRAAVVLKITREGLHKKLARHGLS